MALMSTITSMDVMNRAMYPYLYRRRNKPVTCRCHREKIRMKRFSRRLYG